MKKIEDQYKVILQQASNVDITLADHVTALKNQTMRRLQELEKKMVRAEKRKFNIEHYQLKKIKSVLFPHNNLQERVENISGLYAKHGKELIDILLQNSLSVEQQFTIINFTNED